MKCKITVCLIFTAYLGFAQNKENVNRSTLDVNQFYGTILLHNPAIAHLIDSHPGGLILSLNRKTYGLAPWEQRYNYPDLGGSFIYQEFNNEILGRSFAVYAHYNFYFLKRNVQLRLGQGIAYNTNPYDKVTNFRNNAFGTSFLSSTYFMLNFHRENIIKSVGFKAGIVAIHYSNGNIKAPNTSTNTLAFNAGLTYDLDGGQKRTYIHTELEKITEPIRYNLAFRTGINESDVINSGQFPFFVFSAYADKRLGSLSAIQVGTDVFLSKFLKEQIKYQSIAFPEKNSDASTDYKRIGVFVGHELFMNKTSIITQLGYYAYDPYDFEGRVYNRIGMKAYFKGNLYAVLSLKSHAAKAEAIEFGIGLRL